MVQVSCAEVELERQIQRVGKSGKWCSKELSNVCSIKKVKAAKKVCGTHFGRRLAEYYKANNVDPVEQVAQSSVKQNTSEPPSNELTKASVANLDATVADAENSQDAQSVELSREMLEIRKQKLLIEERKRQLELKAQELRELESSVN